MIVLITKDESLQKLIEKVDKEVKVLESSEGVNLSEFSFAALVVDVAIVNEWKDIIRLWKTGDTFGSLGPPPVFLAVDRASLQESVFDRLREIVDDFILNVATATVEELRIRIKVLPSYKSKRFRKRTTTTGDKNESSESKENNLLKADLSSERKMTEDASSVTSKPDEEWRYRYEHLKREYDKVVWVKLREYKFKFIPEIKKIKNENEGVGVYAFKSFLGKGSYGVVKLAINTKTEEQVAIKTMEKSLFKSVDDVERLDNEIKVLTMIGAHKNVVRMIDSFHTPLSIHMVMDVINGGDLVSYVSNNDGPLSDETISFLFKQLVTAVEYMHSRGLCHRDIKPENCLLTDSLELKLSDMGFATKMTPGSFISTFCGSPNYVCPEIIAEDHYDGLLADCWSLGATLYYLTTGNEDERYAKLLQSPEEKNSKEYIYKEMENITEDILSENNITGRPLELQDLLRDLLRVDPKARISTSKALQYPFLGGVGSTTSPGRGGRAANRLSLDPMKVKIGTPRVPGFPPTPSTTKNTRRESWESGGRTESKENPISPPPGGAFNALNRTLPSLSPSNSSGGNSPRVNNRKAPL